MPPRDARPRSTLPAGRFALVYVLAAGAWIAWSDRLASALSRTPQDFETLSLWKGWLFVVVTGLLLWLGLRSERGRLAAAEDRLRRLNGALAMVVAAGEQLRGAASDTEIRAIGCRLPIEHGLAAVAFACVPGGTPGSLVLTASHGLEAPLDALASSWAGDGPLAEAAAGRAPVVRDVGEAQPAPWAAEARRLGLVTLVALPVLRGGATVAVLGLGMRERAAALEPVLELLARFATDLAWADAERAAAAATAQLRALASRLQRVREDEKARIARDLHDQLGQLLTGLNMDVDWLEARLEQLPAGPGTSALVDRVVAASELSRQTLAEVQRIASDLRPASLDRLGLGDALRQEARRFAVRASIRCTAEIAEPLPALSPGQATALYRIAQEALTNVARHARARSVTLRLAADPGGVALVVTDDGVGLAPAAADGPAALGLAGMRERAAMEGGTVSFERAPAGGTVVIARLPAVARGGPGSSG